MVPKSCFLWRLQEDKTKLQTDKTCFKNGSLVRPQKEMILSGEGRAEGSLRWVGVAASTQYQV